MSDPVKKKIFAVQRRREAFPAVFGCVPGGRLQDDTDILVAVFAGG